MTYVYRFGGGVSDGGKGDRNLLGGKGANLAEMASIGLPVPPGSVFAELQKIMPDEIALVRIGLKVAKPLMPAFCPIRLNGHFGHFGQSVTHA